MRRRRRRRPHLGVGLRLTRGEDGSIDVPRRFHLDEFLLRNHRGPLEMLAAQHVAAAAHVVRFEKAGATLETIIIIIIIFFLFFSK